MSTFMSNSHSTKSSVSFDEIECMPIDIPRWSAFVSLEKMRDSNNSDTNSSCMSEYGVVNPVYDMPICFVPAKTGENESKNHTLRQHNTFSFLCLQWFGLLVSTACNGFLEGFLDQAFFPLLAAYLGFSRKQFVAVYHLAQLCGTLTLFFGIISDYYPICGLHRKPYILGAWIFSYFLVLALLVVVVVDDSAQYQLSNFRTYHRGILYVLLSIGISWSASIVSVTSLACVLEASHNKTLQGRAMTTIEFLAVKTLSRAFGIASSTFVLDYNGNLLNITSSASLKTVLIIMGVNTLIPIPTVLFGMPEEKCAPQNRIWKTTGSFKAHFRFMWTILQEQHNYHLLLITCCAILLNDFTFNVANDAVIYWAGITPKMQILNLVIRYLWMAGTTILYRFYLINTSWKDLGIISTTLFVVIGLIASLPVVFNSIRNHIYFTCIISMQGIPQALMDIIFYLPLVEITPYGLEASLVGIVEGFQVLARLAIETYSFRISETRSYTKAELIHDAAPTHVAIMLLLLGNALINSLAIAPMQYLSPKQVPITSDYSSLPRNARNIRAAGIVLLYLVLFMFTLVANGLLI
uniref:Transmembrane protein putative n=1 Tax=Albugo laibachii Nc14 TaxID=890382 RepID=F0W8X7_9STRA|nr:transmembrane protein putative [Albugo laibachii Nc14]|eukprot:CCA17588.1 transmembrane protein putative [Albugo laibachii Nc14]